jgi:hypothetical protein
LIAAAAVGLTQSMFIALATTLLQIATPDHVRGRVLALYWGSGSGVMGFRTSPSAVWPMGSAPGRCSRCQVSRSSR